MILIKGHLRDVTIENVLDNTDWLAGLCVPNFDRSISCHEYFQAFFGENRLAYWVVVGVFGNEGAVILIDAEIARTANKTSMFGHSFNAIQLVGNV